VAYSVKDRGGALAVSRLDYLIIPDRAARLTELRSRPWRFAAPTWRDKSSECYGWIRRQSTGA